MITPTRKKRSNLMKENETQKIIGLVLKAVAVGLSIASIVMGFIPGVADADTHITLLGIGLAALAVASLMKED
jgi:hypothetical protein